MADPKQVMGILQDARELIRDSWGCDNLKVAFDDADGSHCASIGIVHACTAAAFNDNRETQDAAHVAVLHATGAHVPSDRMEMYLAVYRFNDSQTDRGPVLAAFDKAIANLGAELDPTPQADMALAVMAACDQAGDVLADQIVSEHPELPRDEVAAMASSEFFYAAQDTAKACSHGTKLVRA